MSLFKLAYESLVFYRRTNLGVLLAVMVSTSVLTGALFVGDSVRFSLMKMVNARLGGTEFALVSQGRFFRAQLPDNLAQELDTNAAPVLQVRGLIQNDDGSKRANRIEVLGVDERFYKIGTGQNPFTSKAVSSLVDANEAVILNRPLAAKLNIVPGDEIVLRVEKPSLMPRDVPLTPDSDLSTAFRLKVGPIASESDFGRFSLRSNQVAPFNAFVPLRWLQDKLGRQGSANVMLVASNEKNNVTIEKVNESVKELWNLGDAELEFRRLDGRDILELRSKRVFIDGFLSHAALKVGGDSLGILTYFVNELRLGNKTTPYSMVSAIQPSADANSIIPLGMNDDEIIINQWLADDLGAKTGDSIELTYFAMGLSRKLEQKSSSFRVRKILPMSGSAIDPELMPDFPGLADVNNCRDWDPGIAIDLEKIRAKDEDYWDKYRGTPKAFVTLGAGQKIWANRYGNLTAVRYPGKNQSEQDIAQKLLDTVDPASVGLFFMPVRQQGTKAGGGTTDFGQLFLGLSMFLIMASLILTGLLFVFGVENRSEQIGLFLAVGLLPKQVKRLLLVEGGLLAIFGAALGTLSALLYTKVMIYGLATIWRSAIAGSQILFFARGSSIWIGAFGAVIISVIAIRLTLRKQISRPARELLAGQLRWQYFKAKQKSKGRIGLWIAVVAVFGAVILIALMGAGGSSAASGAFFGAGALLLIGGLGLSHSLLRIVAGRWNRAVTSLAGLGLRNSTRRPGRSLAVVGLLACGIFLVIAIGANKQDPLAHARQRDSGTGGFALYGESAIPILYDLNSSTGRKSMRLDDRSLEGVEIVQFRVHEGDDASCLNLNRAQVPRILGVQPEQLYQRGAFSFSSVMKGAEKKDGWLLLNRDPNDDVVPAIGDYATVVWALGKSLGDEIEYTDEKGQRFHLQIVGMLNNTILQGSLIISEEEFVRRFPSDEGYRMFLVDSDQSDIEGLSDKLTLRLADFGLDLTPTTQRLAEFMAVENTYLSIFQLLGVLGLVLGSIGLGLVVLRNVLERRGELAMLQAVGFDKATLKKMIFDEHGGLMLAGLLCGVITALIAVFPALQTRGVHIPYLTIIAIGISAVIWIWVATTIALTGRMLDALRNE
jgi:putative ABC transport system permease protein